MSRPTGGSRVTVKRAMELTERQELIFRAIVEMYIGTARPVGSAALLQHASLNVSSATVRNEMAVLEDLGYIRHLHTSGGRVPTNMGYRYYVERLMERPLLPNSEARTIRHQFHQVAPEPNEWIKLAATVLANRMHNVGLVTAPRALEIRLRHLEVISIQSTVALVILVLHDGTVLQEMVTLAEQRSQEDLSALADHLSVALRGLTPAQIECRTEPAGTVEGSIVKGVTRLLHRAEEQHALVVHAGLTELLRQPEFTGARPGEPAGASNERLQHVVEFLHQGFAVQRLLSQLPAHASVQIVIGEETPTEGLEDYSFVLGRYGDQDEGLGFLGIVGPTRMAYPRAVALVQYMSNLMNDLMDVY